VTKCMSGALGALVLLAASTAQAQGGGAQPQQPAPPMGFFITSAGPGDGANLGGLQGADRHCQQLAQGAGAGGRTWRAYLSAAGAAGQPPVNARDRIGNGPWYNAKGALIAWNVADLHGDVHRDRNSINKEFALDEKGNAVKGRGDTPNQHDILTGSDSHGRLPLGNAAAVTCNNWTSNAAGSAMLGHHDRSGGGNSSWNAAHASRGCSQQDLVATGGAGLFYCFAAN
jgi:hypothetical protein